MPFSLDLTETVREVGDSNFPAWWRTCTPPSDPTAYSTVALAPVSVAPGTVPATQRSELGIIRIVGKHDVRWTRGVGK